MQDDFFLYSGLKPNLDKSIIFFAGVRDVERNQLSHILPISGGELPVRYLGVPLITTRLHAYDCKVLIDKITNRVQSWSNRLLTYVGRAQLITSVLFSTQIYWSSIFILPQKVLKSIEAILRTFFWTGPDLKKSGAKVKWSNVCAPKKEGGLRFRSLKYWNRAAMSKLLWAIASKADTLWIRWIHTYLFKDQCLWTMNTPTNASWTIRKLFNLRQWVHLWVKSIVGNGKNTFLWLDNWHPFGPLKDCFGDRMDQNLLRSLTSMVSSIIKNNTWHSGRRRNPVINELLDSIPANLQPNTSQEDTVSWTFNCYWDV